MHLPKVTSQDGDLAHAYQAMEGGLLTAELSKIILQS